MIRVVYLTGIGAAAAEEYIIKQRFTESTCEEIARSGFWRLVKVGMFGNRDRKVFVPPSAIIEIGEQS